MCGIIIIFPSEDRRSEYKLVMKNENKNNLVTFEDMDDYYK